MTVGGIPIHCWKILRKYHCYPTNFTFFRPDNRNKALAVTLFFHKAIWPSWRSSQRQDQRQGLLNRWYLRASLLLTGQLGQRETAHGNVCSTRVHSGNSNLSRSTAKGGVMSAAQNIPLSYDDRVPVLGCLARRVLVSAQAVLPIIFNLIHPKSIVDVGCGTGTWLGVAKSLGAKDVVGFEGEWVRGSAKDDLDIRFVDLEQSLRLDRKFDLAICLEVAEHLSAARAASLVDDLCALSDCVLFSAAIPGQGGTNHINERRQSYWAALFAERRFFLCDVIRPRVWNSRAVEWWYKQNSFLYVAETRMSEMDGGIFRTSSALPIDAIHPELSMSVNGETSARRLIARWIPAPN